MILTARIQDVAEPAIEGNRMTGGHLGGAMGVGEIHYVVVLADGIPVAQQSYYHQGTRWWVDDLFVAEAHRGTEVIRVLREATFRAVAERSDDFYAFIDYTVATPAKVLADPIKAALGVKIEVLKERRLVAQYRYDVRALQTQALSAVG